MKKGRNDGNQKKRQKPQLGGKLEEPPLQKVELHSFSYLDEKNGSVDTRRHY